MAMKIYEDIKRYVLEQCDVANIHQIADQQFVDQLVNKLTQSASGMYGTLLRAARGYDSNVDRITGSYSRYCSYAQY